MKTWTEKEIEKIASDYMEEEWDQNVFLDDDFYYGFIEGFKKALELNNLKNEKELKS